jgi:hypothetical protein
MVFSRSAKKGLRFIDPTVEEEPAGGSGET